MDCDQVFMILTRGPFPTGEAWDELVEEHLETCGDCWRLAEALRPALEIFQEAVPPSEGRDLPGYWGDARPAASVVAEISHNATSRTAIAPGLQRVCQQPGSGLSPRLTHELSNTKFRAMAIAATMTAAAAALASMFNG
ncbi:MAG: hypothetical protein U0805_19730 [Pirellulales bacterium]